MNILNVIVEMNFVIYVLNNGKEVIHAKIKIIIKDNNKDNKIEIKIIEFKDNKILGSFKIYQDCFDTIFFIKFFLDIYFI